MFTFCMCKTTRNACTRVPVSIGHEVARVTWCGYGSQSIEKNSTSFDWIYAYFWWCHDVFQARKPKYIPCNTVHCSLCWFFTIVFILKIAFHLLLPRVMWCYAGTTRKLREIQGWDKRWLLDERLRDLPDFTWFPMWLYSGKILNPILLSYLYLCTDI